MYKPDFKMGNTGNTGNTEEKIAYIYEVSFERKPIKISSHPIKTYKNNRKAVDTIRRSYSEQTNRIITSKLKARVDDTFVSWDTKWEDIENGAEFYIWGAIDEGKANEVITELGDQKTVSIVSNNLTFELSKYIKKG